jgi:hypothetical protein
VRDLAGCSDSELNQEDFEAGTGVFVGVMVGVMGSDFVDLKASLKCLKREMAEASGGFQVGCFPVVFEVYCVDRVC